MDERKRAQAREREKRRGPRDRSGRDQSGQASGAANRAKKKAASRSGLANELIERGCPELANLVDADDDCAEYEALVDWAEAEVSAPHAHAHHTHTTAAPHAADPA